MATQATEVDALSVAPITFRQLADAMPQMVWSTLPDGSVDYYNARWYEFTGAPVGSTDGEAWKRLLHPDDQERAFGVWRRSIQTEEPYEIEYRLQHHSGKYRWTLGRGLPVRDEQGAIIRWVGTCTDIDHHKQTANLNAILSRELSHRIKNIFAVISGIIGISARQFPDMAALASQLQSRVTALGRAHDYARPHSEESVPHNGPRLLSELLRQLLLPYPALDEGRLTISGDDLPIDDRGATPIGLAFHEFATNSMKYGAMSVPEGRVDLSITRQGETVAIHWQESDGPPVTLPDHTGFGTQLAEIAIVAQLDGTIERDWDPAGLKICVKVLAERLSRD